MLFIRTLRSLRRGSTWARSGKPLKTRLRSWWWQWEPRTGAGRGLHVSLADFTLRRGWTDWCQARQQHSWAGNTGRQRDPGLERCRACVELSEQKTDGLWAGHISIVSIIDCAGQYDDDEKVWMIIIIMNCILFLCQGRKNNWYNELFMLMSPLEQATCWQLRLGSQFW